MSYEFLFDLALILMTTKLLGLLTKQIHLPQVVGALLAGLILGPVGLNWLHETDFILQLAELGVIILMFTAGLESDLKELKETWKSSLVIALFGMIIPLLGGFAIAHVFNRDGFSDVTTPIILQNIFIGIILTATSVSITVETLKEMGKLNSRAGNAILGAAVIDDILGVIALTAVTSVTNASVSVGAVLFKIVLFFIFAVVAGMLFSKFVYAYLQTHDRDLRRYVVLSFVFCLLLAYIAEHFFGVADITGAFIAGLCLSGFKRKHYLLHRFETSSYMLLAPVFFASIGIKVVLPEFSNTILWLSIALIGVAILTKLLGCTLGALTCRYSKEEAFQIGTGMISRGEVALIVANKGMAVGLLGNAFFGPVVVMVIVTTILTPILLKLVFKEKEEATLKPCEGAN